MSICSMGGGRWGEGRGPLGSIMLIILSFINVHCTVCTYEEKQIRSTDLQDSKST